MGKKVKKRSKKPGLPPGSLIHVGEQRIDQIKVETYNYNSETFEYKELEAFNDVQVVLSNGLYSWINIDGLHDVEFVEKIGKQFELHQLLLEDVLNTNHRPKIEEFDNCTFVSLKMLKFSNEDGALVTDQVSIILGKDWLVTFLEESSDVFDDLKSRLKEGKGNLRLKSIDYLFYRLIDVVVDNYFTVIEQYSEKIEALEQSVIKSAEQEDLYEIQFLKRQLSSFRKALFPIREIILQLQRDGSSFIADDIHRYLHDVFEHVIQVTEAVDSERETLNSIMDLYLNGVSNKMNQIMKVLTIISTIFIPLTFIAGIYGMNFDNIPELHWHYGYFGIWGLMIVLIIIMVIFFKRKKWL